MKKCDFCDNLKPSQVYRARPFCTVIGSGERATVMEFLPDWFACAKCSFAIDLGDTKQLWAHWLEGAMTSPELRAELEKPELRPFLEDGTKKLYQTFMANWLGTSRPLTAEDLADKGKQVASE